MKITIITLSGRGTNTSFVTAVLGELTPDQKRQFAEGIDAEENGDWEDKNVEIISFRTVEAKAFDEESAGLDFVSVWPQ